MRELFSNDSLHCIVFGHSHQPVNEFVDGILMLNPGSATVPRWGKHPTCGLLYSQGSQLEGKIMPFNIITNHFRNNKDAEGG
ncbi:MAG: metallophosphoesterase family protein [Dethiobacteria bacterium]|nr:hypothetical protein [Bacillota bacterium]